MRCAHAYAHRGAAVGSGTRTTAASPDLARFAGGLVGSSGDERLQRAGVRVRQESTPLPPDIQSDLRLQELADLAEDLEALEHFEELRREADERAW